MSLAWHDPISINICTPIPCQMQRRRKEFLFLLNHDPKNLMKVSDLADHQDQVRTIIHREQAEQGYYYYWELAVLFFRASSIDLEIPSSLFSS